MRDCWVSQIYQIFNNKLKRLHRFSRGCLAKNLHEKQIRKLQNSKKKRIRAICVIYVTVIYKCKEPPTTISARTYLFLILLMAEKMHRE